MHIYRTEGETYRSVREGTAVCRLDQAILGGTGADRLDLLHRISTADVASLRPGMEGTTILTNEKGRVIDLLRVIALENEIIMILRNNSPETVIEWLDRYTIMDDFTVTDRSDELALIGLYGDSSSRIADSVVGVRTTAKGEIAQGSMDGETVTLLRSEGLNGPFGLLLLCKSQIADKLTEQLVAAGAINIDNELLNVLRIEAGQPGFDSELGEEFNPLEAGLVSNVSFTKGCYIGQEVISRLDSYDKVKRHLKGIRLADFDVEKGAGRELILREPVEGDVIGKVTSIAESPTIGTIALAFIRSAHATPELPVIVTEEGSNEQIGSGTVSLLPFSVPED